MNMVVTVHMREPTVELLNGHNVKLYSKSFYICLLPFTLVLEADFYPVFWLIQSSPRDGNVGIIN